MNSKDFTVICPHCKLYVIIQEINCAIFRHGIMKKNNSQMNPHLCKGECERYVKEDLIIGCGKPFKIILQKDEYIAEICDYI